MLGLTKLVENVSAPTLAAIGPDLSAATMLLNLNPILTGAPAAAGPRDAATDSLGEPATAWQQPDPVSGFRRAAKGRSATRKKATATPSDDEEELAAKRIKRDPMPWLLPPPAVLTMTALGPSSPPPPESPPEGALVRLGTATTPPGAPRHDPHTPLAPPAPPRCKVAAPPPKAPAADKGLSSAGGPLWNSLVSAEGKVRDMRKKPQPPSLESSLACVPTPNSKNRVPRKKILWREPNKL